MIFFNFCFFRAQLQVVWWMSFSPWLCQIHSPRYFKNVYSTRSVSKWIMKLILIINPTIQLAGETHTPQYQINCWLILVDTVSDNLSFRCWWWRVAILRAFLPLGSWVDTNTFLLSVLPQPGKSLHCQIRPHYTDPVGQQSRNTKIIFNDLCAITLPRVYEINTCPRTNCC